MCNEVVMACQGDAAYDAMFKFRMCAACATKKEVNQRVDGRTWCFQCEGCCKVYMYPMLGGFRVAQEDLAFRCNACYINAEDAFNAAVSRAFNTTEQPARTTALGGHLNLSPELNAYIDRGGPSNTNPSQNAVPITPGQQPTHKRPRPDDASQNLGDDGAGDDE